jgi:hypothetical protein
MIGIITAIGGLVSEGIGYFKDRQKAIHEKKMAVIKNQQRLAESSQSHNQAWEMKQLDNAGWKDDVLFYLFVFLFLYAGFFPEKAGLFFENLNTLPEWFIKTWFWIVASVLGVKKIGDYAPQLLDGLVGTWSKIKNKAGS